MAWLKCSTIALPSLNGQDPITSHFYTVTAYNQASWYHFFSWSHTLGATIIIFIYLQGYKYRVIFLLVNFYMLPELFLLSICNVTIYI